MNDTITNLIADIRKWEKNAKTNSAEPRLAEVSSALVSVLHPITTRLEQLMKDGFYFTPEAMRKFAEEQSQKDAGLSFEDASEPTTQDRVFKIGCQPAVYKKGDGHFTAIAHGGPTTYVMDVRRWRGRFVGQFLIDNKETLSMMGDSFRRVILCLASASNAYIAMNQRAKERKRRRSAAQKEGK